MKALTPHDQALADQLTDDGEHVAVCPIPSVDLAREEGMPVEVWMRHRAELLESVGAGISELCEHGWQLHVHQLTRPDELARP